MLAIPGMILHKVGQTQSPVPMSHFFEHQKSSFKRSYMKNLISLAGTDGQLKVEEMSLITKIGLRRGLKLWQIRELFDDKSNHELFIPQSIANRMNMLHDVMELVYADRLAANNELSFIENLLDAFQLKRETMVRLLELFHDGTPSATDWREFEDSVSSIVVEE